MCSHRFSFQFTNDKLPFRVYTDRDISIVSLSLLKCDHSKEDMQTVLRGTQIMLLPIRKQPSHYSFGHLKAQNSQTSLDGVLKINKVCAFNLTTIAMQYLCVDYLQKKKKKKNAGSLGISPETKFSHIYFPSIRTVFRGLQHLQYIT